MKSKLLPTIVLTSICIIVALLLAVVNMITAPTIARIQWEKEQAALAKVYPDGENFVEKAFEDLPDIISKVYTEDGGGYVFQMSVTGYKSGLVIMCGVDPDGKVTGADFIKSSETLSAEVGLGEKYVGVTAESFEPILVSSATKTTKAYGEAVKAALDAFEIISEKEGK